MATMSIYFPEAEQAKEVRAALEKLAKAHGLTTPQLKGGGAVNALLEALAKGELVVTWAPEEAPEDDYGIFSAPDFDEAAERSFARHRAATEPPEGLLSDQEVIDLLNQQTPKPWEGDWGEPWAVKPKGAFGLPE